MLLKIIYILTDIYNFNLTSTKFIVDKGFDTKAIHNFIRFDLKYLTYIAINNRNSKEFSKIY